MCRYYDRVAAQEALIEQKMNEEKDEDESEDEELTPEQIWMVSVHARFTAFAIANTGAAKHTHNKHSHNKRTTYALTPHSFFLPTPRLAWMPACSHCTNPRSSLLTFGAWETLDCENAS